MTPTDQFAPAVARTKRCRYCNEEIQIAAQKCKHCGEYLSPAARRAAGAPTGASAVLAGFRAPIAEAVVALLFCLPLGAIALIFAVQADAKMKAGDAMGAKSAAGTAKGLAAIGMIIGVVLGGLFLASSIH